jgi:tetratricopeptide (TPR) repeat protein
MRVLLIIMVVIVGSGSVCGQSLNQKRKETLNQATESQTQAAPQKPTLSAASQHYMMKYATASRWNDIDVARDALYDLIIENPSNDSLIFTLGYLYLENQKYASSLLIAQDLLNRNPKNEAYLELAAVSAQEIGVTDRALQHFENLYLLNKNIATLYQIAFLQFNLKKYAESQSSADVILSKPESGTLTVVFNDPQGKPKEYPMKVAVINLKGLIALEKGDKAGARKQFNEALAAAPDFVPARDNLAKAK